jgi:hypothetical protein
VNLLVPENQNPTISISTKAVFGVKTDPHNDHRFASFEEISYSGNICLWDDRKTTEAISFFKKIFCLKLKN